MTEEDIPPGEITLVRVTQTSIACPSQWDAWDADGNYYYLRFRHGHGEMRRYRTADWVGSDDDQYISTVASFTDEDEWAGDITLQEFAARTGVLLSPGVKTTPYWLHVEDEVSKELGREIRLPWVLEES